MSMPRLALWGGALVALNTLAASLAIGYEYLTRPQAMLRSVTHWMHSHHFAILPSAAWLLAVIALQCFAVAGLVICAFAIHHGWRRASFAALEPLLFRRATMGGASPFQHPFERYTMNVQEIELEVEIGIFNFALSAAANDKSTFYAVMQKVVAKVGSALDSYAKAALKAGLRKEPLLQEFASAFEPQVDALIDGQIQSLEGQATGEEDALIAKGVLWIQGELSAAEAELAGLKASDSAPAPVTSSLAAPHLVEEEPPIPLV